MLLDLSVKTKMSDAVSPLKGSTILARTIPKIPRPESLVTGLILFVAYDLVVTPKAENKDAPAPKDKTPRHRGPALISKMEGAPIVSLFVINIAVRANKS